MQTIEEYKAYTKQLENEVGKWHHAYDALVIERNALVRKILETEKSVSVKDYENGCDCVMLTKEAFEAMSEELEELRKHEVAWDTDKAQIKVYEQRLAAADEIDKERMKQLNELYNSRRKTNGNKTQHQRLQGNCRQRKKNVHKT